MTPEQAQQTTLRRAEDLLLMVLTGRPQEASLMLQTVPDDELRLLVHAMTIHAANGYLQGRERDDVIRAFTQIKNEDEGMTHD